MSVTGIDLFAGGGGTSTGAVQCGVKMLWAANHKKAAVDCHELNHPLTLHIRQDLHQADWSLVPKHDIAFASPCCQGHSKASGKGGGSKKADVSRSTAWAVVSCLEYHKTPIAIIENVTEFQKWSLFNVWCEAMKQLGYSMSLNYINLADLGGAQSRLRLIIVCTRTKHPLELDLGATEHAPARSIIDTNFEGHKWDLVTNRSLPTQRRVENGRRKFGDLFLEAAYSGEAGGRSIDKPIGTITTINKHYVVMGDYIRPITIEEMAKAQTFPADYIWPTQKTITKELIGNAVPPLLSRRYTEAVLRAA
ncbi:DNA cytosine methyltransferase [Shewanella glacialipiscicola]|uniref:DNA cytosine methyltransferase n=1 Tax=Shewanella glacialipiscicola TaxID=614069 RepID=UPI003D7BE6FB